MMPASRTTAITIHHGKELLGMGETGSTLGLGEALSLDDTVGAVLGVMLGLGVGVGMVLGVTLGLGLGSGAY